jgi:hypothetical protein
MPHPAPCYGPQSQYEILTALNMPVDFILAIVEVDGTAALREGKVLHAAA